MSPILRVHLGFRLVQFKGLSTLSSSDIRKPVLNLWVEVNIALISIHAAGLSDTDLCRIFCCGMHLFWSYNARLPYNNGAVPGQSFA
jgi:hypothetical protein